MKKRLLLVLAAVLAAVFAVALALPGAIVSRVVSGHVDYRGYATAYYPMQAVYTPGQFGLEAQEIRLETDDGYALWASEVAPETPRAVVIYLSGIRQPSVSYYYGHIQWLLGRGCAGLLLELRGHGQSDGQRVALGYEEVADVRAALAYVRSQRRYDGLPIILLGVSMGGAVAVNAFGQLPDIDALIAQSAYSSFEDVMADTACLYGLPEFLGNALKPWLRFGLRQHFGAAVDTLTPQLQVQNIARRPALFIAAQGDTEVLPANTQRLLAAAPAHCQGWIRPSDDHFIVLGGDLANVQRDSEYCLRVGGFIDSVIAGAR